MLHAVVRFASKSPEPFFTTSPASPRSFFSIHFVTISADVLALRGARLRLGGDRLEDHLRVEVVAVLAERVEQRRERLGLVTSEDAALALLLILPVAPSFTSPETLTPLLLEDRLQRIAGEELRVVDALRVADEARVGADRARDLRRQALAALARLGELEADGVGAGLGRLHGPLDVDEARRVEAHASRSAPLRWDARSS